MPLLLDLLIRHMTLLIIIALLRSHLTWEVSWRDTVDSNLCLFEFRRHQFAKVYRGGFGSVIGKVTLGDAYHAGHGGDYDYGRGAAAVAGGGGLEKGEEGNRCEVHGGDVGVEDSGPVGEGLGGPEFFP